MVKMIIDNHYDSDIIISGGGNWAQYPFQRIDAGRSSNYSDVRE
jgi:hypothetical protein